MAVIKDGAGTGNTLKITSENRGLVSAVVSSLDHHDICRAPAGALQISIQEIL